MHTIPRTSTSFRLLGRMGGLVLAACCKSACGPNLLRRSSVTSGRTLPPSSLHLGVLGSFFNALLVGAVALLAAGCGRAETPSNLIFSWVLVKASNPNPDNAPGEDCKLVGIDKIRLEIGTKYIFEYPCAQNSAQSQSVPAETYHVRVSAMGLAGNLVQSKEFPQTYIFGPTKLGSVRLQVP